MTADVNFGLLRRVVAGVEGAQPHGPVGQGQFLREMGIGARLTALAEQPHVTEEQVRLTAVMGSRYSAVPTSAGRDRVRLWHRNLPTYTVTHAMPNPCTGLGIVRCWQG